MWKLVTGLGCIFSSGEICGVEKVLSSRHIHSDACGNVICVEGEPRFLFYRIPGLAGTVVCSSEIEGGLREMGLTTPLCAGHGCCVHCRW